MKRGATPADLDFGSAYEGFNPAHATDKVSAPLITTAGHWGYVTGFQIQNVDTEPVTVTFPCAWMCMPEKVYVTIDPGESVSFSPDGSYAGSILVTATGRIVGIVNEFNPGWNDHFFTYSALNY